MPSPADREKALETALAQIDRQFGKGSVMRLGSDERAPVEVIPTGSIALDVALGIGGLPRGGCPALALVRGRKAGAHAMIGPDPIATRRRLDLEDMFGTR